MFKKIIYFLLFLLSFFVLNLPQSFADLNKYVCTDITADLSYGVSNNNVLLIQKFLVSAGYLSSTPNGNFGPATLSALKKFQSANGISATGFVGPQTRSIIKKLSCVTTPISQPTVTTPSSSASSPSTQNVSKVMFTSPKSQESVTFGDTYTIKWTGPVNPDYSLVLEDESGIARGFIATYPGIENQYSWDVGSVNVAGNNSNELVSSGNYRVRLQSRTQGKSNNDPRSDLFTITSPVMYISSLYPSTLPADNKTVGVLYGSGFIGHTNIYLGGMYNLPVSILYTSPDNKVIVFSVPTNIPYGSYGLFLANQYGSNLSGGATLTVTKP